MPEPPAAEQASSQRKSSLLTLSGSVPPSRPPHPAARRQRSSLSWLSSSSSWPACSLVIPGAACDCTIRYRRLSLSPSDGERVGVRDPRLSAIVHFQGATGIRGGALQGGGGHVLGRREGRRVKLDLKIGVAKKRGKGCRQGAGHSLSHADSPRHLHPPGRPSHALTRGPVTGLAQSPAAAASTAPPASHAPH